MENLISKNNVENDSLKLARRLKEAENITSAIDAYKRVLSINPTLQEALCELGEIYFLQQNQPDLALPIFQKLLEHYTGNNQYKVCLGLCYLKMKQYEKGWKFFENRLETKNIGIPKWNGEDLKDRNILIYSERGFGDCIMFSRYIKKLQSLGANIVFMPPEELFDLYKNQKWGIKLIKKLELIPLDFHASVMSLPYCFTKMNSFSIPYTDGYLYPNSKKSAEYNFKYFTGKKLKIGINWQGNTDYDKKRVVPKENFTNLIKRYKNQVEFFSLQQGDNINDIINLKFENFDETLAAISNLDIIITNDTSIAHLACAMAKPCWILLPEVSDWRWGVNEKFSDWYKSAQLFRKKNSWRDSFLEIEVAITHELCKKIKI